MWNMNISCAVENHSATLYCAWQYTAWIWIACIVYIWRQQRLNNNHKVCSGTFSFRHCQRTDKERKRYLRSHHATHHWPCLQVSINLVHRPCLAAWLPLAGRPFGHEWLGRTHGMAKRMIFMPGCIFHALSHRHIICTTNASNSIEWCK